MDLHNWQPEFTARELSSVFNFSPIEVLRDADMETTIQASSTCNPALLAELEESAAKDSAWFNVPYDIKNSSYAFRQIKTGVDTQSGYSIMDSRAADSLGLKLHPTKEQIPLQGMFEGKMVAFRYVEATIACPIIGLGPVEVPVLVVTANEIEGQLLLGTKFIKKFGILRKILEAEEKYGEIPPGMTDESLRELKDNIIKAISDGRSKSQKKKDQEKYKQGQGETASALADILHVKSLQNSGAVTSGAGGSSNPSYSRTSTWDSAMSVFSGDESIASTVATTVSSSSAATQVLNKGEEVDQNGGSA